jgi:hypothetical protein
MYCSISEAWGNNNKIYDFNKNITNNNIIENFKDELKNIKCDDFLKHIVDCNECQKILTQKFCKNQRPLIDLNLIDKNTKETIIIFIFGLILIMIFNMFFD